jgi:nitrogen fixation NifU-like protein
MTEVLKGKTLDEARRLFAQFHARVTGGAPDDLLADLPETLQDDVDRLEPLTGVKAYPVRVKCATLPWHAFEAALKSGPAGDTVKTE